MKLLRHSFLFALLSFAACAQPPKANSISLCDILASPMSYNEKEATVSGLMRLSFESQLLACDKTPDGKAPIWISFDREKIAQKSPAFLAAVNDDSKLAASGKQGVQRRIIAHGKIRFSKEMVESPDQPHPFAGFGHMGGTWGEIVVDEIIQYGPAE